MIIIVYIVTCQFFCWNLMSSQFWQLQWMLLIFSYVIMSHFIFSLVTLIFAHDIRNVCVWYFIEHQVMLCVTCTWIEYTFYRKHGFFSIISNLKSMSVFFLINCFPNRQLLSISDFEEGDRVLFWFLIHLKFVPFPDIV